MRITVVSPIKSQRANHRKVHRLLDFLLNKAARKSRQQWNDISLVLTDDAGIRSVNRIHLGHDYPTDVISFTYAPMPSQPVMAPSGELFVNLDLASRIGPRFRGKDHELALYIAHGCDHLAGAEDSTPILRRRMRRRELRWLAEASRLNLLAGLVRP